MVNLGESEPFEGEGAEDCMDFLHDDAVPLIFGKRRIIELVSSALTIAEELSS